jgi:phenylacetyl-CoA:acceptor oxidoreductase subunit 2
MTREGSVAVVLFALVLFGLTFKISFIMGIAGIAGLLFLFCQGQMLKASKGIPSWREPTIVLLIVVTGICEGTAIMLIFLCLQYEVSIVLNLACLVFLAIRISSWLIYRKNLGEAKVPAVTLTNLEKIHFFQIIAGNVIPVILIVLSLSVPEWATLAIISAGVLVIIAGWHMKFTIITRAAQVQGYALSKVQRGRPMIRPPVRRNPDKFVY